MGDDFGKIPIFVNTKDKETNTAIRNLANKVNEHVWKLAHVAVITANAQSYTVSNLDGNNQYVYMIITRFICQGGDGSSYYYIRPNADTDTAHYGNQYVSGAVAVVAAGQTTSDTGLYIGLGGANNEMSFADTMLFAKVEGAKPRYSTSRIIQRASGTTIGAVLTNGGVWNDTTNNITSLQFYAARANGIGANSRIEIWSRG